MSQVNRAIENDDAAAPSPPSYRWRSIRREPPEQFGEYGKVLLDDGPCAGRWSSSAGGWFTVDAGGVQRNLNPSCWSPLPEEWRRIETARKDGSLIVLDSDQGTVVAGWFPSCGGWGIRQPDEIFRHVSAWQWAPLPE
jgi:hypothetical protein